MEKEQQSQLAVYIDYIDSFVRVKKAERKLTL